MESDVTRQRDGLDDRNEESPTDRPEWMPGRGGIDVFDSVLVRQPIRAGRTDSVRELLTDWAQVAKQDGGDVTSLLPVQGVTLVTLFFDRGAYAAETNDDEQDALLWYVEVVDTDTAQWADPDETIREQSPLFETGLGELLDPTGTVHADGRDGHQLITHATNPDRQERYADVCGQSLVAPVAGDSLPIPVVVTTIPIKRGTVSWLVRRGVAIGNWVKQFDTVSERMRDETETLEAEAMYTESLLLEPVDDRLVLHYYMETEDMDRLYEAYTESDNWDVQFSDWVMRRIFVNSDDVLEPPLESDCAVLLHAVHPART